jgi:ABC-type phosphate transport system substrate-binding protein
MTLSALAVSPAPAYRIICHPDNPIATADRQFVGDLFLKKINTWPTGEASRPVDLAPGSPVRRAFTEEVLRRPVEAVRSYWQQRIFAGRDLPPPELDSDDAVVKYVLKHRGAIGYVSGQAALGGAKVLTIR